MRSRADPDVGGDFAQVRFALEAPPGVPEISTVPNARFVWQR